MITLNIAPDSLKKEIQHRQIFESYKKILGIILISLCIYGMAVLFALYLVQQYYVETIQKTNVVTKSSENYASQVIEANNKITAIIGIQDEFVKWSSLLKIISENIGGGIRLNQLTLNREKSTIYISGTAATRDDLLELKDSLDSLGLFSEINLPISSLLQRDNINFEILAQISKYDF